MSINRSSARNIAMRNAKKAGINRACSHGNGEKSWFAAHWRSLFKKK